MVEEFKNNKGETFIQLLDEAKEQLKQGRYDLAIIPLKLFEKQIPDDSDVAEEAKKRLDKLYSWYNSTKKYLSKEENSGNLLEIPDIIKEKNNTRLTFYWQKYYIFKNLYLKFRLYENEALVDYEL